MAAAVVRRVGIAAVAMMAGFALLGCGGSSDATSAGGGVTSSQDVVAKLPGGEEFAAAKKIYADKNCAGCHRLGETGKMKSAPGAGPELTKTGAQAEHTKKWLAEHIRDPKSHRPQSRMPQYPVEQLNDADLEKLAAYLEAQK